MTMGRETPREDATKRTRRAKYHAAAHRGAVPNVTRRAMVVQLYRGGRSARAVAEAVGISHQAVLRMLDRCGEPRRPRGGNMGGHSRHRAGA